jgi:hypothetical protein
MSASKSKEAIVEKALHYFNVEGWNCAEYVLSSVIKVVIVHVSIW